MLIYRNVFKNQTRYKADLYAAEDILREWAEANINEKYRDPRFEIPARSAFQAVDNIVFDSQHGGSRSNRILEDELSEAGQRTIGILFAHGTTFNGVWAYSESRNKSTQRYIHSIDMWLRQHDGKYGAIVLNCCNIDCIKPKALSTTIFYAEGIIGPVEEYDYKVAFIKPKNRAP
jgi:hypothetical protein